MPAGPVTLRVGRIAARQIYREATYKGVYINYLMDKSDKIKQIEKPFNDLITLIGNLGEKGKELTLNADVRV